MGAVRQALGASQCRPLGAGLQRHGHARQPAINDELTTTHHAPRSTHFEDPGSGQAGRHSPSTRRRGLREQLGDVSAEGRSSSVPSTRRRGLREQLGEVSARGRSSSVGDVFPHGDGSSEEDIRNIGYDDRQPDIEEAAAIADATFHDEVHADITFRNPDTQVPDASQKAAPALGVVSRVELTQGRRAGMRGAIIGPVRSPAGYTQWAIKFGE